MRVPAAMAWWRKVEGGSAWLDSLPGIVETCARKWRLRVGDPFEAGSISLVVPCEREDGSEAILKVNFPEPDSEREVDALAFWDGDGAVRLFEADQERRALLEERCRPGEQLWGVGDDEEATHIAAGALRRWAARLGAIAAGTDLHVDREMLEATVEWLEGRSAAQGAHRGAASGLSRRQPVAGTAAAIAGHRSEAVGRGA